MKLNKEQLEAATKFLETVNKEFLKNGTQPPFVLTESKTEEGTEYTLSFVLPEFGICVYGGNLPEDGK